MIAIRNVEILSPVRAPFNEEYRFRITFECISPLEDGESGSHIMLRLFPTRRREPSLQMFIQGATFRYLGLMKPEGGCSTRC